MFGLFNKTNKRIKIDASNVFIDNENKNIGKAIEIEHVFKLLQPIPEIKVFENGELVRCYKIETLITNSDLTGQFLHCSIRVLANSALMIDGIISKSNAKFPDWTNDEYEGIRLQPFYLSDKKESNNQLVGKGLFERGLHFPGTVTPSSVRNICVCDKCNHSFTIQHFHAGFSNVQYFYSSDSTETLLVPYNAIENLPAQLQGDVDNLTLGAMEANLPAPNNNNGGSFKYYNSFRGPYCLACYIDFENNKEFRSNEYYGNTYINVKPTYWSKKGNERSTY